LRGSRRTRLTLVLLLLTAFTLTALDYNTAQSGPLAALRRGIDTVFGPVQKAVGSAASSVGNALGGLPRLGSYQSDNRKLRQENADLKGRIAAQAGLQCRYDELAALMNFAQKTGTKPLAAHVVGVGSSAEFEWTVTLDVGSMDGVKAGMAVVNGYGLVGRTITVSRATTVVLLVNDPKSEVGGTMAGLGVFGIAKGNGAGPLTLEFSGRDVIKKNTVVLTNGGGIYAPGIPLGTITSTSYDPNGTVRTAKLTPFVDPTHLGAVGVLVTPNRDAPRPPFIPLGPGPSPTSTPCPSAVPHGPAPTSTPAPTPTATLAPTPSQTP
jgi:rod shape-determining protein MreC